MTTISEDEWKDLVGPTVAADGQVLLAALQKKNWRHSWTRYFATNFSGHGRNYFQNPGHAFLLERLAKVDPDDLDGELKKHLVTGLLKVTEGYENDVDMAVLSMGLLKSWHEMSAVHVLTQIVSRMKQMFSVMTIFVSDRIEPRQAMWIAVHAYDALRALDPERCESIWGLAEIVKNFEDSGRSKMEISNLATAGKNIVTLGQLFQTDLSRPYAPGLKDTLEYAILLSLDADTQFAILNSSKSKALTKDMAEILFARWAEFTPEQREYLLTHPDPVVADGAFEILAGELENNPQMEMPHGFILATRNRFLTETDPVRQHRQIEVLATAIRQDPGLRESLIDRPVHWQLWRVLDGNLDGKILKDILFLLENGEVSESRLDFILGLMSREDESVFLVVRKILLKSRQGLEGRLGALIQEKTGQDPHAVRHALEILALLQEMPGSEALSARTLESVRAVLWHENSTASEVKVALRVLRLAGTLKADVEASRSRGATIHHHVVESSGFGGYDEKLAEHLGQIVRDPKSPLSLVEAAAHALVAMNSKAVIPLLEDIFDRQRQDHSSSWINALMAAVAVLGQADTMDPGILSNLRSRALPPEVESEAVPQEKKPAKRPSKNKTSSRTPEFVVDPAHAQWWQDLPDRAEEFVTEHLKLTGAEAEAKVKELLEMEKSNYEKLMVQKDGVHELIRDSLVFIPAGFFMMGSEDGENDEKPVHAVWVSSLLMMDHEVTNKEWRQIMGTNPSLRYDGNGKIFSGDDQPVVGVTWSSANLFAKNAGLVLPTEAQWEYAARAGRQYVHPTMSGILGHELAVYWQKHTAPVKSKPPNPFGLWDMAGNVWEWCADAYYQYSAEAQINPSGPASGEYYNLRGGSWGNDWQYLRSATRNDVTPDYSDSDIGFRCARSPSQD